MCYDPVGVDIFFSWAALMLLTCCGNINVNDDRLCTTLNPWKWNEAGFDRMFIYYSRSKGKDEISGSVLGKFPYEMAHWGQQQL